MKKAFAAAGLIAFLFVPLLALARDKTKLLVVSGEPWIDQASLYGSVGRAVHVLESVYALPYMVGDEYDLTSVSWNYRGVNQLEGFQDRIKDFRVVVFWDAPAAYVPAEFSKALVAWVEKGGVFVMAGGLTCFSGFGGPYGAISDNFEIKPYGTHFGTEIGKILPVELFNAEETQAAFKPIAVQTGSGLFADIKPHAFTNAASATAMTNSVVAGVPWSTLKSFLYHKTRARAGALALVTTDKGDPLVAAADKGKGRVIAVTLAPRAALLVRADPLWTYEPHFWKRLLAWSLGRSPDVALNEVKLETAETGIKALVHVTSTPERYSGCSLEAELTTPRGETVKASLAKMSANNVVTFNAAPMPGSYSVRAQVRKGKAIRGEAFGALSLPSPNVLTIEALRFAFDRGEKASIAVKYSRGTKALLRLCAPQGQALEQLEIGPSGQAVTLDTAKYRPGVYQLEAVVEDAGRVLDRKAFDFTVFEQVFPRFKYGLWAFSCGPDLDEGYYKLYRDLKCTFMLDYHFNPVNSQTAYKYGIQNMAHLNFFTYAGMTKEEEAGANQIVLDGSGAPFLAASGMSDFVPCPRSPATLRRAQESIRAALEIRNKFAGFQYANLEEEWWMGYGNPYEKKRGVACYCASCKAAYKQAAGQEAPPPVYRKPGYIAPEDDPWFRWSRVIRRASFNDYHRELKKFKDRIDPGLKMMALDVGDSAEFEVVDRELYFHCWKNSALMTPKVLDYCYGIQEGLMPERPAWLLIGLFRMPESAGISSENLSLCAKIALGEGGRCLMMWVDSYLSATWPHPRATRSIQDEARLLGAMLEQYGPMFLNLKRERMPAALLMSFITEDYAQIAEPDGAPIDPERPWRHQQTLEVAFPALFRAVGCDLILDEQILADRLQDYETLVLAGHEYAGAGVVKKIEAFAAAGGKVYRDKSSAVPIKGAKDIPLDFQQWHWDIVAGKRPMFSPIDKSFWTGWDRREQLTDKAVAVLKQSVAPELKRRPVILSDDKAAYSLMQNGDTHYVFIYNTDEDHPGKARDITVEMPEAQGWLYDVFGGAKPAAVQGGVKRREKIASGDWKVYVLAPAAIKKLDVKAPATARVGEPYEFSVAVKDGKQAAIKGAFPLKVEIVDAAGVVTPYSGYAATDGGVLKGAFRPAANDPGGQWTIKVRDLLAGCEVARAFKVSAK